MGRRNESRRIGGRARRRFIRAMRNGRPIEQAAAIAGHSFSVFYKMRLRDADFAKAWAAAAEASSGPRLIRANNGRRLQWRRVRRLRFDTDRKAVFLNHFAGCGDFEEACAVAGVEESTVYKHRRKDPNFAEGFQSALEQSYARLEVEAVRQRLIAQKRLRRAIEEGIPTGEVAEEFERVLKLLNRWDRRNGRIGMRSAAPERRQALSFDEAIALLETKLRNLDIPILELPPDIAARYDGDGPSPGDDEGEEGEEGEGDEADGGEGPS